MKDVGTEILTSFADNGHTIPLAVQLFLWGQSEPFFRQKLGRLYEASCVSFEHVLVENKLQGLPPSLYEAINSTPRWRMIEASLPHVMHCASVLLHNRNKLGQADKLGVPATKLIRTLHCILLEAIVNVQSRQEIELDSFVNDIRLFVFLFAPIANVMKESDLTFKLASGDKLWQALWSHNSPDYPSLSTPISETQTVISEDEESSEEFPEINLLPPSTETLHMGFSANSSTKHLPFAVAKHHRVNVFDIAVLQCLFFPHWSEEGMLWGVTYLLKRLKPCSDCNDANKRDKNINKWRRSRSMYEPSHSKTQENSNSHFTQSRLPMDSGIKGREKKGSFLKRHWKNIKIKKNSLSLSGSNTRISMRSPRRKSCQETAKDKNERISPKIARQLSFRTRVSFRSKSNEKPSVELSQPDDKPPSYSETMGQKQKSSVPIIVERRQGRSGNTTNITECRKSEPLLLLPPNYDNATAHCSNKLNVRSSLTICNSPEVIAHTSSLEEHEYPKLSQSHRSWHSDSNINYTWRSPLSATKNMTTNFVTKDGYLRMDAIIRAVEVVASREPNLKIYSICLQILQIIMDTVFMNGNYRMNEGGKVFKCEQNKPKDHDIARMVHVVLIVICAMGCEQNCSRSTHRGAAGQRIRLKARRMLAELYMTYSESCSNAIRKEILGGSLQKATDILHLILVTCAIEFNSTKQGQFNARKWTDESIESNSNCENLLTNAIMTCVYEGFIKMCLKNLDMVYSNNHQMLYREIREFVQFVKLHQESAFNKVLLTILMIPAKKRRQWKQKKEDTSKQKPKGGSWEKKSGKRRGAIDMLNSPFLPRHKIASMWEEEADESPRSSSMFGRLPLTNWLKGKQQDSMSDEGLPDISTPNIEKSRQESRSFISLIKGKNKKSSFETEFKEVNYDPGQSSKPKQQNPNEFEVDPVDILEGAKILRFIMGCCPPGTVPEPKIIAAALELESPVVARAAFFTECASFVHRCCAGGWPRWMTPNSKGYLMHTSNHMIRKTLTMQNACHKLFYSWGEALAKRLEYILVAENSNALHSARTENEKVKLYLRDLQEDYLKDMTVNETGTVCPVSLRMLAGCLLQEITTFICDAAPHYKKQQKTKNPKSPVKKSVNVSSAETMRASQSSQGSYEDKIGSRRRSITFFDQQPLFGIQENSIAKKTILESCMKNDDKRKISFGSRVDDSPIIVECTNDDTEQVTHFKNTEQDVTEKTKLLQPVQRKNLEDSFLNVDKLRERSASLNRHPSLTISHTSQMGGGNFLTVPTLYQQGMSSSNNSFGSAISVGSTSSIFSADEPSGLFMENYGMFGDNPMCTDARIASQSTSSVENDDCSTNLPWLSICLTMANQQNFICEHNGFCQAFCHKRLTRSCARLTQALGVIYESEFDSHHHNTFDVHLIPKKQSQYIVRYVKRSMACLMTTPFTTMTKGATHLNEDMFFDVQSLCWELILDSSKDLARTAAVLFLLSAIKNPHQVFASIMSELQHVDAYLRLEAILKLKTLWECRHCVWGLTQDGANKIFKIPPAAMKYSLPKEPVGTKHLPIPDAPWLPHVMDLDEVIAQSTTTAISHEKEKQIKIALQQAEQERSSARSQFHLNDISIPQYVAAEVQTSQCSTNTIEEEDTDFSARRYSCRLTSVCSSNQSYRESRHDDSRTPMRQIGKPSKRSSEASGDLREDVASINRDMGKSPVFPPCIAACIPTLVQMINDNDCAKDNLMVGEVAASVFESCLKDDPDLFLRQVFDGVSGNDDPQSLTNLLQKLPQQIGRLPAHVAYTIFVNILCPIIKTTKKTQPASNENTIACIGVLAKIAPYVEGLELKSLKMSLRKEQNDTQILITGGSPGPKKLAVYNHSDFYIPTMIDVNDESTFESVISEFVKNNDMPPIPGKTYQLMDSALNIINCPHAYVRDTYTFNKSSYPELTCVEMCEKESEKEIKRRACLMQMEEINKLKFVLSILISHNSSQTSTQITDKKSRKIKERQLNASFILEEFLRLKSFPRKAIYAPFDLFGGKYGDQIFDLDMVQKYYWMELISSMFSSLPCEYPWGSELLLFLHVWNAALVIHAEQLFILRRYCAAVIDVACHLNSNFLKYGYEAILPTILKVYSQRHNISDVKKCIEFLCKQLHILHRQPFVLELMASAAPALMQYQQNRFSEDENLNREHISPELFLCLLQSLNRETAEDTYLVLPLVTSTIPQQSLDFCYKNESTIITICDCFRLCATVIACQPESPRTLQMLTVIDCLLPCYLHELHKNTKLTMTTSTEIGAIKDIGAIIRAILLSLECLARFSPMPMLFNKSGFKDGGGDPPVAEKLMEEGCLHPKERVKDKLEEILAPHDVTLHLCTNFYTHAQQRLQHLEINCSQPTDVFNAKAHLRLAEIAQTVFKLLPDDCLCIDSPGLIHYLSNLIPVVDWTNESTRASLFMVLKRLERLYSKIGNMNTTSREMIRWDSLQTIVIGITKLISRNSAICAIPHLRNIINYNLQLLVGGGPVTWNDNFSSRIQGTESRLPIKYIPCAIQLIMVYLQTMKNSIRLQILVRPLLQAKKDCVLMNFFIPLCVNILYAYREYDHRTCVRMPVIEDDVMFLFSTAFETLLKNCKASASNNISQLLLFTSPISHKRDNLSQRVSLLLLKVLITCFHKLIHKHWFSIATKIKEFACNRLGDLSVWKFMLFVMSLNTPLVIYLRPIVLYQVTESLQTVVTTQQYTTIDMSKLVVEFEAEIRVLRDDYKACSRLNNKFGDRPTSEKPRVGSFRHAVLPGAFGRKGSQRQGEHHSPDKSKHGTIKYKGSMDSQVSEQSSSPNVSPRLYQPRKESRGSSKRWAGNVGLCSFSLTSEPPAIEPVCKRLNLFARDWKTGFYNVKDRRKRYSESSYTEQRSVVSSLKNVNRSQSVRQVRSQHNFPIPEITVNLVETPVNMRRHTDNSEYDNKGEDSASLVRRGTFPSTKSAEKKMNYKENCFRTTVELHNGNDTDEETSSLLSNEQRSDDEIFVDCNGSAEASAFLSAGENSHSSRKYTNKPPQKKRERPVLNFQNMSVTMKSGDSTFTNTVLSPLIESPVMYTCIAVEENSNNNA